jgi:hypothetical protein
MELRNENTEKRRKRKLIPRGPVLVRSVKAGQGQVISASFENQSKAPAGIWKKAS